ncbi:high mobility group (HMG)-box protein [Medicago truncatula]|uniref:High mobility group (HMG)-box protein n=1 Tax=Medicago truncatula TaxID=3880 RepID=G7JCA3_MEDTR|nr:high mobility group (HMG)-box protein [Medicago truncatula]
MRNLPKRNLRRICLLTSKASASTSKKKSKDADEDVKKKKQKKKRDPNAPKSVLSGFKLFSRKERENLKKTNIGISFTDVVRVIGEKWKKMSDMAR